MYERQAEDQSGPRRTLQQNLLLPCDLLARETPVPAPKESQPSDPALDPAHQEPTDEEDEKPRSFYLCTKIVHLQFSRNF